MDRESSTDPPAGKTEACGLAGRAARSRKGQVEITIKNNPVSNSDIGNKYNPNLVLLVMLNECLQARFNHNLADQLLKTNDVLCTKMA